MADNEVRATLIIAAKDETAAAMSSAATETKTATEEIKKSGAMPSLATAPDRV